MSPTDTRQVAPRLALLGLGAAARNIHLPACEMLDIPVVAGADPSESCRVAAKAAAPALAVYDDAARLLESERPDWAIIAAPPAAHRELCLLALSHGAHVLCEKPFTESVQDADEIISAAARADRSVAVNLEFAHMPVFAAARDAIGGDDFGRLLFVQAWQQIVDHDGEIAAWRSSANTMQEFGSHVVDLCIEMFGDYPETVYARMPNLAEPAAGDLVDVVTLDFPDGRVASIILDRVSRGSHTYLEMRLDGERGSIRTSLGGKAEVSLSVSPKTRTPKARFEFAPGGLAWLEQGERRRTLARNPRDIFADATARHFRAVIDAVAAGKTPPGSAVRARQVVAIVAAAYDSARSGAAVNVVPPP